MQRLSCEQIYNVWISEPNLIRIVDLRSQEDYERQHIPGAIRVTAQSLPAVLWMHKNRLIVLFGEEQPSPALEAVCGPDCVMMDKSLEWFDLGWPSVGLRRALTAAQDTAATGPEISLERFEQQGRETAWLLVDHEAREFCVVDAHDGVKRRCDELKGKGYQLCLLFRSQSPAQDLEHELAAAYKARVCIPKGYADEDTD
ncbi:MAG TPA: rhodanese-like domain-containing protein, partial [Oligoflexus sp.]|uniref:rhodanese-like domain-containing protein n=1 Tax=Oligoflexus sp. TaxID=1971216 RepID=UPI002D80A71A